MLTHFDQFERKEFAATVKQYENLSGLEVKDVRGDLGHGGLLLDLYYPDGDWAGTLSCDLPFNETLAKLHRYIEAMQVTVAEVAV